MCKSWSSDALGYISFIWEVQTWAEAANYFRDMEQNYNSKEYKEDPNFDPALIENGLLTRGNLLLVLFFQFLIFNVLDARVSTSRKTTLQSPPQGCFPLRMTILYLLTNFQENQKILEQLSPKNLK